MEDAPVAEVQAYNWQETNKQKVPLQANSSSCQVYIQTVRTGPLQENQGDCPLRHGDRQI